MQCEQIKAKYNYIFGKAIDIAELLIRLVAPLNTDTSRVAILVKEENTRQII